MNAKRITREGIAIAGFVALGLSPSFIDWQEQPDKHYQIIWYYVIALTLIWFGVFSKSGESL